MFGCILCYYFTPLLSMAALLFPRQQLEELGTVSVSGGLKSPSRLSRSLRVPNDETL